MAKITLAPASGFASVVRSCALVVLVLALCLLSLPALAEARLGIVVDRVPDNTANAHNLAPDTGAHIVRVIPGGPSARAGLQAGDIILRINEHLVRGAENVAEIAQTLTPGQAVPVEIMRYGSLMQVYVQPSL
jgi:serine protease Do